MKIKCTWENNDTPEFSLSGLTVEQKEYVSSLCKDLTAKIKSFLGTEFVWIVSGGLTRSYSTEKKTFCLELSCSDPDVEVNTALLDKLGEIIPKEICLEVMIYDDVEEFYHNLPFQLESFILS